MSENTFPISDVDELVSFFRSVVLTRLESKDFTKADLTPVPKPEVVQTLYMRVLDLLYDFRPECHLMIPPLEDIQFPAYQESSTAILSVFTRMRQFLPLCLVYDFSLKDLLAPKKQRTLTILSAIKNFLHFWIQRTERMQPITDQFRVNMDNLQSYTEAISEAEKKIEVLTTIPPEKQAEADELAAALSELQTTIMHEYQDANTKNDNIAEWKVKIAEKNQKLAQLKEEISYQKDDISRLRSQIVESPEELKSQMEKMRESAKNLKTSIEETNECVMELQSRMQGVSQTEAGIQLTYSLLHDLESSMKSGKEVQEEVEELSVQFEKKLKELKNLCANESQLKRTMAMKVEKQSTQSLRRQKNRSMKEQHIRDIIRYCDQIPHKREETVEKIQAISAETQQVKAKTKSLQDVCNQETERAQALFDNLCTALDELHKKIETYTTELKMNLTH